MIRSYSGFMRGQSRLSIGKIICLGKKLDRNFELYSDVVTKEKDDNIDVISSGRARGLDPSTSKISNLEINVVRKEDPLVAIKVKEEKLRQEKLENPLLLLRMQRILREEMEKKARKTLKREKKASKKKGYESRDEKRKSRHDSSSRRDKHKHDKKAKRKSRSSARHRRHDDNESDSEYIVKRRKRHDSARSGSSRKSSDVERYPGRSLKGRKREYSNGSGKKTEEVASTSKENNDAEVMQQKKKSRKLDSHIPEHLRSKYNSSSDSSDEMRNRKSDLEDRDKNLGLQKYGLVGGKKTERKRSPRVETYSAQLFSKLERQVYVKPERKKLTEEEINARREEMLKNAEWRQKSRKDSLKRIEEKERLEEKDNEGKPVEFIKSMVNNATSSMTVEERLNSKRQGLQRSHGYMEQKFANR